MVQAREEVWGALKQELVASHPLRGKVRLSKARGG